MSKETGVSDQTIRNWLRSLKTDNLDEAEVSPESRNTSEKMTLLLEGRSGRSIQKNLQIFK